MKTNVTLISIILLCLYPHIFFAQTSKDIPWSSFGKAIGLVKSTSGKPVAGIEVHLIAVSGSTYSIIDTTRTNSKGVWFINHVKPGKYAAWVGKIPDKIRGAIEREVKAEEITQFSAHIMNDKT